MAEEQGPSPDSSVAWRTNARRPFLLSRVRYLFLLTAGLFFAALSFDALPFDFDIPGVPDVELSLPFYATLSVAWVIALVAAYASWLLYANSPERIGFHREGIVIGYPRHRTSLALRLFSYSAPTQVRWKEVRRISTSGPLHLSRHDLTLRTYRGRSWVLVGLSPELLRAVAESFEAHLELAATGLWRGHAPVPLELRGPGRP